MLLFYMIGVAMSVIYRITCIENKKYYIGSTVNKVQRWARHRRDLRTDKHKNKNMQASWNKYGEAAFLFEIIEVVEDALQLMAVEQRWLDACVGQPECFNYNKFADAPWRGKSGAEMPMYGKKLSLESRAKLSAALSGDKHPNWGRVLSAETRLKIKKANETNPWRGSTHTPEAIAKIAAASRGRPVSIETRYKRSIALKGREITSLTRAKISKTLSGEGNFWYGKERSDSFKEKVRKAVEVTNAEGVVTKYASIKAMREALGLTPTTVNRALKAGTPVLNGKLRGCTVKYVAPPAAV
jgi:group I intron endonuclease